MHLLGSHLEFMVKTVKESFKDKKRNLTRKREILQSLWKIEW